MQVIKRVGFIGAGNMATQLIAGFLKENTLLPNAILASDLHASNLDQLKTTYGIKTTKDNGALLQESDLLILAVKPQSFSHLASTLHDELRNTSCQAVMSIMAGVTITSLRKSLKTCLPIIRAMPNMASRLGLGCTGLFGESDVSLALKTDVATLMQCIGKILWVEQETQLNALTAVSGSGPAYFFLLIEALEKAAKQQGFSEESAKLLVRQTALGAAHMVQDEHVDIANLCAQVASPSGTTAAALSVLEAGEFTALLERAVQAATDRSTVLSQESYD